MRQNDKKQAPLTSTQIAHQHSRELEAISTILDANPQLAEAAKRDLSGERRTDVGREGMSGEQAIRVALLKQIHRATYRDLAFRLVDSSVFRRFSRLPFGKAIKVATLQSNVKRLTAKTWEAINQALLMAALEAKVETGRKVRTDCTVVESNIHEPTDSSLLWDCVRVGTRLMMQAPELAPDLDWSFLHDRRRRAKTRAFEIQFPPRGKGEKKAQRRRAYGDLLKVAAEVAGHCALTELKLGGVASSDVMHAARIAALRLELVAHLESMKQVQDQTRRRVIDGEKVPASEKLLSIFEKHTDIIIKDNYETFFGHKVCLTGGASSMIIDCVVEDGNPADSTLVERSMKRAKAIYGRTPRQAAFDGGFASKENLKKAKKLGVKDVAFHKKCGLKITEMAQSAWVFKNLRNFRAGIEGCISTLKRAFKMDRCT